MPKKYNLIAKTSEDDGEGERVLQGYDDRMIMIADVYRVLRVEQHHDIGISPFTVAFDLITKGRSEHGDMVFIVEEESEA